MDEVLKFSALVFLPRFLIGTNKKSKYTKLLLISIITMVLPGYALGLTPAEINAAARQAETIQRQEQERMLQEREQARKLPERVEGLDTESLKPKLTTSTSETTCRNITKITIDGASKLSSSLQKRLESEFTDRCLSVSDLEKILSEITAYYIDKGYITTRAYLPAQGLNSGELKILVIEGVINKIDLDDKDGHDASIFNVFPSSEGDVLNLRDLEQGIDQINRLTSNNALLDIRPGAQPGQSDVIVHNRRGFPYHFNVSVDNQGSESTGKRQGGVSATADNVLGFYESFNISHRRSIPNDHGEKYSTSNNFNFNFPLGYTNVSVGLSRSEYESAIMTTAGNKLITSGKNKNDNIRVDHVFYRDRATRGAFAFTLTTKGADNFLNDEYLGVSSRELTILELGGSVNTQWLGGILSANAAYINGLDKFGALSDPGGLPNSAPKAQFTKYSLGLNYQRPFSVFDQSFSFSSQLTGQKAQDALFGSEQISIGGIYSVRGFVDNSLSGDSGYYLRNELSHRRPIYIASEVLSTRFYIGYDTGSVSNSRTDNPDGHLSGMVLGLSTNWRGLTWDFFSTRALSLPDSMVKESTQSWFRLAYAY